MQKSCYPPPALTLSLSFSFYCLRLEGFGLICEALRRLLWQSVGCPRQLTLPSQRWHPLRPWRYFFMSGSSLKPKQSEVDRRTWLWKRKYEEGEDIENLASQMCYLDSTFVCGFGFYIQYIVYSVEGVSHNGLTLIYPLQGYEEDHFNRFPSNLPLIIVCRLYLSICLLFLSS